MSSNLLDNLKIIFVVFLFVACIIPFIKKLAVHIGAVDIPGGRHIHEKIMPKLGGLAVFFGFLLGYMLFCVQTPQMISILIGGIIILVFGIFDDIKRLPPSTQFIGQLASACVVVFYGNIVMQDVSAYGLYINFGVLAPILTIIFIVALMNCLNFIDGLDGLAGGIATIFFVTISIVISYTGIYNGLDASLSLIMIGATLGFLLHNFHPAKIFLGNSGSMFLGYMISVISLLGFKNVTITSFVIPILILAIPILDTFFAITRRLLKGESPTKGDKKHLHHQLLQMTSSQVKTVLIIYLINILFSFASIVYVIKNAKLGQIIYIVLLILVLWLVLTTDILFDRKTIKEDIKNKIRRKKK
ncbi:MAG: undecaprenyl/decaprenyl-phosphate alpha-N-acetylglucosaminyl 1-phosphate transferase [Bacilli bacterium]|nr:undecaprenyl/decaprenyl-phosphate alpha-N-acetylglucosaminyl 1-phosphate transferase [Bacilli bacterium]